MLKLKISVILCSCDGQKYIHEQLQSIASQTRLPDELVICDDVSSDDTIKIIDDFSSTAPFPVRVIINSRRLGSTKNFELGVTKSNGDIIVFADQDDVWMNNKLERFEGVFNTSPETDVIFSDALIVDELLEPLGYTQWQSVRFFDTERRQFSSNALSVLLRYNMVQGACMAFRSRINNSILPIPADVMHDAWIALIIAIIGSIRSIPEPLIMYRQHGNNQLGSSTQSSIFGTITKVMHMDRSRHVKAITLTLRLYEQLIDHLRTIGWDDSASTRLQPNIDKKINHLKCRLGIVKRIPKWPLLWLRELLLTRYYRYSMGWWSAGYDLIQGSLHGAVSNRTKKSVRA